MPYFGAHMSIAGGFHNALIAAQKHACGAVQVFTKAPSQWAGKPITFDLKKALKTEFEESVWDHLSGTVSAPFTEADTRDVAVKVIDDRGNELLVVRSLDEAE